MIKYDNVMMKTALIWAEQSKCKRGKVGAVISKEGRIISIGYNGTPSGFITNNCEKPIYICSDCKNKLKKEDTILNICPHCRKCPINFEENLKTDHSIVIHAEANAILFAAKQGLALQETTMYVTHAPCKECAKMIVQSGINRLVYLNDYHNDGLDFLKKTGVYVEKLLEIKEDEV